jgi:hypothetical protein
MPNPERNAMARMLRAVLAAALVASLGVGCGDEAGEDAASVPEQAAPAVEPPAPPAEEQADEIVEVRVVLTEWSIGLERDSIGPGAVTFRVLNEGGGDHALVIRSGDEEWETEPLPPGGSVRMSVHLGAGDYEVFCPLLREGVFHADLGMTGRLRVR